VVGTEEEKGEKKRRRRKPSIKKKGRGKGHCFFYYLTWEEE